MEDVLEVYQRPSDPQYPVVCLDEQPTQLIGETRQPISAEPGQEQRYDDEYERLGTANTFMIVEPLAGWRKANVRATKTALDLAQEIKEWLDVNDRLMPLTGTDWPLDEESRDGWWDGLPYPLYDMRPQGYMGRQWARAAHRALGVPHHPAVWNDDILFALSRLGVDMSGNLILGDATVARWQADALAPPTPIPEPATAAAYASLAEQALLEGGAGSSKAGEFPKFTARRDLAGSLTLHVRSLDSRAAWAAESGDGRRPSARSRWPRRAAGSRDRRS